MDFEPICRIVDTVIDLSVRDKRALVHDLAHRAAVVLNVEDDVVFSALLKREELGSTGVGNGVPIPHVRLEQVRNPFGIVVRLKDPTRPFNCAPRKSRIRPTIAAWSR